MDQINEESQDEATDPVFFIFGSDSSIDTIVSDSNAISNLRRERSPSVLNSPPPSSPGSDSNIGADSPLSSPATPTSVINNVVPIWRTTQEPGVAFQVPDPTFETPDARRSPKRFRRLSYDSDFIDDESSIPDSETPDPPEGDWTHFLRNLPGVNSGSTISPFENPLLRRNHNFSNLFTLRPSSNQVSAVSNSNSMLVGEPSVTSNLLSTPKEDNPSCSNEKQIFSFGQMNPFLSLFSNSFSNFTFNSSSVSTPMSSISNQNSFFDSRSLVSNNKEPRNTSNLFRNRFPQSYLMDSSRNFVTTPAGGIHGKTININNLYINIGQSSRSRNAFFDEQSNDNEIHSRNLNANQNIEWIDNPFRSLTVTTKPQETSREIPDPCSSNQFRFSKISLTTTTSTVTTQSSASFLRFNDTEVGSSSIRFPPTSRANRFRDICSSSVIGSAPPLLRFNFNTSTPSSNSYLFTSSFARDVLQDRTDNSSSSENTFVPQYSPLYMIRRSIPSSLEFCVSNLIMPLSYDDIFPIGNSATEISTVENIPSTITSYESSITTTSNSSDGILESNSSSDLHQNSSNSPIPIESCISLHNTVNSTRSLITSTVVPNLSTNSSEINTNTDSTSGNDEILTPYTTGNPNISSSQGDYGSNSISVSTGAGSVTDDQVDTISHSHTEVDENTVIVSTSSSSITSEEAAHFEYMANNLLVTSTNLPIQASSESSTTLRLVRNAINDLETTPSNDIDSLISRIIETTIENNEPVSESFITESNTDVSNENFIVPNPPLSDTFVQTSNVFNPQLYGSSLSAENSNSIIVNSTLRTNLLSANRFRRMTSEGCFRFPRSRRRVSHLNLRSENETDTNVTSSNVSPGLNYSTESLSCINLSTSQARTIVNPFSILTVGSNSCAVSRPMISSGIFCGQNLGPTSSNIFENVRMVERVSPSHFVPISLTSSSSNPTSNYTSTTNSNNLFRRSVSCFDNVSSRSFGMEWNRNRRSSGSCSDQNNINIHQGNYNLRMNDELNDNNHFLLYPQQLLPDISAETININNLIIGNGVEAMRSRSFDSFFNQLTISPRCKESRFQYYPTIFRQEVRSGSTSPYLMSISCMEMFSEFSHEEIRVEDYRNRNSCQHSSDGRDYCVNAFPRIATSNDITSITQGNNDLFSNPFSFQKSSILPRSGLNLLQCSRQQLTPPTFGLSAGATSSNIFGSINSSSNSTNNQFHFSQSTATAVSSDQNGETSTIDHTINEADLERNNASYVISRETSMTESVESRVSEDDSFVSDYNERNTELSNRTCDSENTPLVIDTILAEVVAATAGTPRMTKTSLVNTRSTINSDCVLSSWDDVLTVTTEENTSNEPQSSTISISMGNSNLSNQVRKAVDNIKAADGNPNKTIQNTNLDDVQLVPTSVNIDNDSHVTASSISHPTSLTTAPDASSEISTETTETRKTQSQVVPETSSFVISSSANNNTLFPFEIQAIGAVPSDIPSSVGNRTSDTPCTENRASDNGVVCHSSLNSNEIEYHPNAQNFIASISPVNSSGNGDENRSERINNAITEGTNANTAQRRPNRGILSRIRNNRFVRNIFR